MSTVFGMSNRRRLLALGANGQLVLKSEHGEQPVLPAHKPVAFLVVDCSGSMAGEKLIQARRGAEDFAESAIKRGYSVGVIGFADSAHLLSAPSDVVEDVRLSLARLNIQSGTDLAAALRFAASQFKSVPRQSAIVLVSDGMPYPDTPHARESTVAIARATAERRIQIITIGTDDADANFLAKLSTGPDASLFVDPAQLRTGIASAAKLLR